MVQLQRLYYIAHLSIRSPVTLLIASYRTNVFESEEPTLSIKG